MIESDQVATLIVKDMSRLGRNYIEVGQLTETILPMHDAVNAKNQKQSGLCNG